MSIQLKNSRRDPRVQTEAGPMRTTLIGAEPQGQACLVLLHEIFGANDAMREIADAFASLGLTVAIPDLFHRQVDEVELGYTPDDRPRAMELLSGFDVESGVQDGLAVARWLRSRGAERVGLLGFCLGGRLALLGADEGGVDVALAFYPVRMQDHREVMKRLKTPAQVHVGDQDGHIPPDVLQILQQDLDRPPHELHVYPGSGHAFFNRHHPSHDPDAVPKAWERARGFVDRHLLQT